MSVLVTSFPQIPTTTRQTSAKRNKNQLGEDVRYTDETIALKSSEPASCYSDHDEGVNSDSSVSADDDDILDNFDGLESVEETVTKYNGALCGEEALPGAIGSGFIHRRDMFSTDEVGHDMIGNANVGAELMNSEAAQGDSFPEVDPIPIPGPPGSFLPSPRAMNSDDFQGNSSLTTSPAQSSQDLLDLVDGDSSDSPISAASTISNPIATKSDLRYSESLTSAGAAPVEEKIVSGFSSTNTKSYMENAFMNDDQPCCCQRKEISSQGIALNFQQSTLLKRPTMASVTMPAMEMKMGTSPNIRPNNLDVRPGAFSLSSSSSSVPQKVVLLAMKPLASPTPSKGCMDAGVKYSGQVDCESASPSCSTPVLRLMGKNLMLKNSLRGSRVMLPGVSIAIAIATNDGRSRSIRIHALVLKPCSRSLRSLHSLTNHKEGQIPASVQSRPGKPIQVQICGVALLQNVLVSCMCGCIALNRSS
ncbi:hypothetical protein SLEP1_g20134 [Rubroshorea leprosula]|uniref:Uncharacterized protein n=1 Tax=Rubroshorea leprosula TaxID=152421 RepID=A0AAV5J502_9ROSI|nr:hypothetical protein SLEP1_g20134 [Rubroshorea leprosula]